MELENETVGRMLIYGGLRTYGGVQQVAVPVSATTVFEKKQKANAMTRKRRPRSAAMTTNFFC